ncbi:amino acid adenylation domain-containing protein [Flavobacterium circumlabens]|uniref:Amino acid adenylation domain-containing protein n=1 Tax=Flavobacterium circumlabens TaxID=2133765 RepID=A0A4Y7U9R0_9FLAO|nr:non-ribosomal peptide synthetase [Flavobacterium circumlabens]TCN55438.1 amino acid adenylation domain-containing protein [Flavobacterium circumlabens]TEB43150.1 amino acid adenylation domain-containing protein [Flavobacterium circumlabens]
MRLTLPQQDVYFEQLLFPKDPIYNIGAKIEIKGVIDTETFNKAYTTLIDQHDTYRSILVKNQEEIAIRVVEEHDSQLGFVDFSDCLNPEEEAAFYMQKEFKKPFDLFDENLLHVFTLVKVKEDFHYLFSVYHHIITDGWGTSLMFQRLVQNYNEIQEFGNVTTTYPFSYKDFMEDDLEYQNSPAFSEDKKYWVEKFKALPEDLLEKEFSSDEIANNKSHRKELIIKRDVYNQINQLAEACKCSSFHLILAVLYAYFGRKHQNTDFAIGLPVLNRSKSKYKKTVGLFMGIAPLRIVLDFDSTFEDLISLIKNQLRTDYRHQRFPLGKLIQELQVFTEKEKIFNITLSYEKQNYATNFKNTQTRVIPLTHESERVALAIYIREFDELEDVKIDFDYNLNYFNEDRITQTVHHFENLLTSILADPDKKLKELTYVTKEERSQVIETFNATKTDYPKEITLIDLFREQVENFPGKEAVKDEDRSYSYSELHKLSNQIAQYLLTTYGKKDKSPIAVLLERSANMVVVLLGILKSGRSYIPLDPTFPEDRLNYIIDNSQSKILINEKDYALNTSHDVRVVALESILEGIDIFNGTSGKIVSPNDTAYIIYTSGSTGNPKGVEIGHQSLLNFLISMQQKPGVALNDTFFSVTTYSFDISILEFFVPLISGATLYVANQSVLADPNLILQKIEEVQPTIIQATPSFYQMLFHAGWQGDKRLKVMCGGDLLSEALAEKLIENSFELWNMYGPTETTIWSSIKKINHFKEASNIGKPINNTQFYILDSFLSPKPVGTPGAIYIAGDGLAKGYYKNEELTRQKFIANPFDSNSLLYETGDVGKWKDNGEIAFLGRNDNQVKIRGYRIELGDIETQLNQIEGVHNSVVIAKKGDQQEAFLVAYILKNQEIDTEKIKTALKMILPYYMIPNVIISLDEFPLTPNQKIDRKSLSQRAIVQEINYDDFKAPVSDLEKTLAAYWKEVLNSKEPISVHDNFFALGGHSLNAVKLIGLVTKQLSLDISLKTIFDYPTIELLATYLQKLVPNQSVDITLSETKGYYDVTPPQYNIWLASQQENTSIAYNMFAAYHVEGTVNPDKISAAIRKIINKHEILRTSFIEINGIPYQKINPSEKVHFAVSVSESGDENVTEMINKVNNTVFDLEKDVLLRVQLLKVEENKWILLFCTHHIIMDGLSLEIFITEFIENFKESNSLALQKETTLKFQFKDYSEWFNKTLEDNTVKNESFWTRYLHNYQPKDSFDRDFDNRQNEQGAGKYLFEINPDTTLALKKLAFDGQVTFYTVLAAALNVLISKFSNHTDICIATANSGRTIPELNNQIGMFVKTLVLRTKIEKEQTFTALLKNMQRNLLEINEYQNVPFDKIPKSVFDLMLVYQNPEFSFENSIELADLKLTSYPINATYSRMPMVFNLFESGNSLKGIIDYNRNLFDPDTIQIIAAQYSTLLNEILKNPAARLDSIDNKSELEKSTVSDFDFNF